MKVTISVSFICYISVHWLCSNFYHVGIPVTLLHIRGLEICSCTLLFDCFPGTKYSGMIPSKLINSAFVSRVRCLSIWLLLHHAGQASLPLLSGIVQSCQDRTGKCTLLLYLLLLYSVIVIGISLTLVMPVIFIYCSFVVISYTAPSSLFYLC